MNTVLRTIARQLRYRPLPELIGAKVTIDSAASAADTVSAVLATSCPWPLRFIRPQAPWITESLTKYRLLDLTYALEDIQWQSSDAPGASILQQLGFVVQDLAQEDDATSLELLAENIDQEGPVLRLIIEERARPGGAEFPYYMEVSDACLTNADSIWLHKHFYL
jgi:hypothetical protein